MNRPAVSFKRKHRDRYARVEGFCDICSRDTNIKYLAPFYLCERHRVSYKLFRKEWRRDNPQRITIFKRKAIKLMSDVKNSVRSKIKEAMLTKEQRLLRKYAVVNNDGTPNVEGRKLLADILFEQNMESVIERLQLIDEECEKKATKKSKK